MRHAKKGILYIIQQISISTPFTLLYSSPEHNAIDQFFRGGTYSFGLTIYSAPISAADLGRVTVRRIICLD